MVCLLPLPFLFIVIASFARPPFAKLAKKKRRKAKILAKIFLLNDRV